MVHAELVDMLRFEAVKFPLNPKEKRGAAELAAVQIEEVGVRRVHVGRGICVYWWGVCHAVEWALLEAAISLPQIFLATQPPFQFPSFMPPPILPPFLQFDLAELDAASALLKAEVEAVRLAMGHGDMSADDYAEAHDTVAADIIFVPGQGRYLRAASATPADRLASVQAEFDGARREMEREAKRASKLEGRAGVLTNGLCARQEKLRREAEEGWGMLRGAVAELACFKALHEQEQRAAPERMEALQELVARQVARERGLQARFKELRDEKDDLRRALAAVAATATC
jgi:hypothetical protein